MATLIIQEKGVARTRPAVNGEEITIAAPCNCTEVTGVQIAGVQYPFYDACGNNVSNISGKFSEGSLIRVLIDTTNTRAQIINQASASITNETKALFGLGADAVPDDVFRVLSRFQNGLGNEYVWIKQGIEDVVLFESSVTGRIAIQNSYDKLNLTLYNSIKIVDGEPVLFDEWQTFTCTYDKIASVLTTTVLSEGVKYFKDYYYGEVYCTIPGTSYGTYVASDQYRGFMYNVYKYSGVGQELKPLGYVSSPDSNAYPVDDGCTYTALGQLGDAFGGVKVATGSYTGTGAYGASGAKSLAFDFAPKYVAILDVIYANSADRGPYPVHSNDGVHNQLLTEGLPTVYRRYAGFSLSPSDTTMARKSEDGKTIYWYDTNRANTMLNEAGSKYFYIAIG